MTDPSFDAWRAQTPPEGFADRVLRAHEARRLRGRRRATRWGAVAGSLAVAASVLAVLARRPPERGDLTAHARVEVGLGARTVAVLEPGAHVAWRGDEATQDHGSVFYRVERGRVPFRVRTPEGDVVVHGTCFRVSLDDAHGTLAVEVFEGRVSVEHAGRVAWLGAGQSVRSDDAALVREAPAHEPATRQGDADLAAALDQCRAGLASAEAQRVRCEQAPSREAETPPVLGAPADVAPAATRRRLDPTSEQWTGLARAASVAYWLPCGRNAGWRPSPAAIDRLGLSPADADALVEAYARSTRRIWAELRPACTAAVGDGVFRALLATRYPRTTCVQLVLAREWHRDAAALRDAMRAVGEVRAGSRPAPSSGEPLPPVEQMLLALTGESAAFERDLAGALGPDRASDLVHDDALERDGVCMLFDGYTAPAAPPP